MKGKRILCGWLTMVMLCFLLPVHASAAGVFDCYVGIVVGSGPVDFLKGPDEAYPSLGQVYPGYRGFVILEEYGDYYYTTYDGSEAYIRKNHVQPYIQYDYDVWAGIIVGSGPVSFLSHPGEKATILGQEYPGYRGFTILGAIGDYYMTVYGADTAYIPSDRVETYPSNDYLHNGIIVGTEPAQFRSGPGDGYAVLGTEYRGYRGFTALEETNGWLRTVYGTNTAYIRSERVEVLSMQPTYAPTPQIVVGSGAATFYAGPGEQYPVLGVVYPGYRGFAALDWVGDWAYTWHAGQIAYIHADHIQPYQSVPIEVVPPPLEEEGYHPPVEIDTTFRGIKEGEIFHHDIQAGLNVKVYAIADGTIEMKIAYKEDSQGKYMSSYGKHIRFTSSDGKTKAVYAHLNNFEGVESNQITRSMRVSGSKSTLPIDTRKVRKGELIGYVGDTGNAYGVHLHFEMSIDGVRVDPCDYVGIPYRTN